MSDLDSFLTKHQSDFKSTTGRSKPSSDNVLLTVVVFGSDSHTLHIGHLGREFSISREAIIDITDAPENTPNLFGRGRPAEIVVAKDAVLYQEVRIPVSELERGMPFVAARPTTMVPATCEPYSTNELAWRQAHGIQPCNVTPFVTASTSYSATATLTSSTTNSQGYADDTRSDDSGFDDSQGDDVGFLDD